MSTETNSKRTPVRKLVVVLWNQEFFRHVEAALRLLKGQGYELVIHIAHDKAVAQRAIESFQQEFPDVVIERSLQRPGGRRTRLIRATRLFADISAYRQPSSPVPPTHDNDKVPLFGTPWDAPNLGLTAREVGHGAECLPQLHPWD